MSEQAGDPGVHAGTASPRTGSPGDGLPLGGTVRPITRWDESVMHRECADVTSFDAGLAMLVADMVATMYAAPGVGLAANQIGVPLKVFVFDCPDDDEIRHRGVICNPVLELPTGADRCLDEADEGCLSLPGAYAECARPDRARVRGLDHTGAPVTYHGSGLFARCLQHETDHLFGTVFEDRLSKRARRRLRDEAEEHVDDHPLHWPAPPGTPASPLAR
jgi:peptide deformylase